MFKYGEIFLPEEHSVHTKSLAHVRLGLFDGLYVVSQILDFAIEAGRQEIAVPVQLEAYTIDSTLRINLAETAIKLIDGTRDPNSYWLTPSRQLRQLMMLGIEGLRLVRNFRLLGPEYDAELDELVILETLVMMRQGVFLTAEMAQERVIEVLSVYL